MENGISHEKLFFFFFKTQTKQRPGTKKRLFPIIPLNLNAESCQNMNP